MTNFLPDNINPSPFPLITLGKFSVKMAETTDEIILAQRLRYHVFFECMGAHATEEVKQAESDSDVFDTVCDHLLVQYHETPESTPHIVGTYRLLRNDNMQKIGRYYSESEYDIACFRQYNGNVLELGRSCIHPDYRHKAAMQLLWRGIGEYVMHYDIDIMFGCASFSGVNPDEHAQTLSYLHHFHLAPPAICARTLDQFYVPMNRLEKNTINEKKAFMQLPVLIKGYLRLGGVVGDGAFLDHDFNTTDILIAVETKGVGGRYVTKYAPDSVSGGMVET